MITTRLQGGLGNQMFQIAVAYAYAKRHKTKAVFDFNTCHTPLQGNPSTKYAESILKKVPQGNVNITYQFMWNERGHGYREIPKLDGSLLLTGYFQSAKYFEDHEEDIKKLFDFPTEISNKINSYVDRTFPDMVTAVHVRRGDYLKNPDIHPTCDVEYYKKAMEEIGDGDFVFISDDIDWCKENFKGDNIHFSPYTDEIEDLCLISACDNQIIANSTFSWWGAYLCTWADKKVVAPKLWFGDKGPQEQGDIIPDNWIKI